MIHNKAFLLDPRDSDVILLKFSFDGKKWLKKYLDLNRWISAELLLHDASQLSCSLGCPVFTFSYSMYGWQLCFGSWFPTKFNPLKALPLLVAWLGVTRVTDKLVTLFLIICSSAPASITSQNDCRALFFKSTVLNLYNLLLKPRGLLNPTCCSCYGVSLLLIGFQPQQVSSMFILYPYPM